ncbi:hypothetical protein BDD43_3556 [Mucilaginibacter gracilis]|uniref:Histone H1-like protein Hc1 n=1 Tax=Mucilaginibacter gracilis TaxID=423350 RepID=A0A495J306_9SPHI|nr:histone H1 [Mucilaginibacter gracilis]RKR83350.1 hypothetical protein BDD43_3556 [Mucilaginibacter gracilis]
MNTFEKLKAMVNAAETDAVKFYGKGNQSAGVRLRKACMEIKNLAHGCRAEITGLKHKAKK